MQPKGHTELCERKCQSPIDDSKTVVRLERSLQKDGETRIFNVHLHTRGWSPCLRSRPLPIPVPQVSTCSGFVPRPRCNEPLSCGAPVHLFQFRSAGSARDYAYANWPHSDPHPPIDTAGPEPETDICPPVCSSRC